MVSCTHSRILELAKRLENSTGKLLQSLRQVGYGSGEKPLVSLDVLAIMEHEYEIKLCQLERVNNLINPESTSRDHLLNCWLIRHERRKLARKKQNKNKRFNKAKKQDYKRYKEHLESARLRSDKIQWALLVVDNADIRAWLVRRLSPIVNDGKVTESELTRAFNSVGGSDKYYNAVKSRLTMIAENITPQVDLELIKKWAKASLAEKHILLKSYDLSNAQLEYVKAESKRIRLEDKHKAKS
jgi:hypothetical protein